MPSPQHLVLASPDPAALQAGLATLATAAGASVAGWIEPDEAVHLTLTGPLEEAAALLAQLPVDWSARTPLPCGLLVADMDSTIIGCECLDELADYAGVKEAVSAITERAMAGELDFEGALRERVAMLRGLPLAALDACYRDRVRLNPGAEAFVRTMAARGAVCALVSGGFTAFTGQVAAAAGFQLDRANCLLDDGAALTGEVAEPILGRAAKLAALQELAARGGIAADLTLAIGDGANDLDMIEAAGLGIAYRAKPVVAARASARIEHGTLETALFFQGISRADFWRG